MTDTTAPLAPPPSGGSWTRHKDGSLTLDEPPAEMPEAGADPGAEPALEESKPAGRRARAAEAPNPPDGGQA